MFFFYKRFLSPFLHRLSSMIYDPSAACRFSPTCSVYTTLAVRKYGIIHGSILGLKRLFRCHPLSSSPHLDPVP